MPTDVIDVASANGHESEGSDMLGVAGAEQRPAFTAEGQPLTDREVEILGLVARGFRNKQIADELHLSLRTVETHLAHAFAKLKVETRTQALLRAAARGLLVFPMIF